MTQDELRAWLLLMGFTTGSIRKYWNKNTSSKVIAIIFRDHDVTVFYRAPAYNPTVTKEFRSSPQTAFDFLKEKLI